MIWLIGGMAVFFGVHLTASFPRLRHNLVQAIGGRPYKGAFAVLSLAGLALMIMGMSRAPPVVLWRPPPAATVAAVIFMAPALILLAASNFQGNIKRITRHPMSLGMLILSLSHLLANGNLAAMLLFGGFAWFALHDMRSSHSPAVAKNSEEPNEPVSIKPDMLAGAIGVATYGLLMAFHRALFGVAIF